MKGKLFATAAAVLAAMIGLVALLCLMGQAGSSVLRAQQALAAPRQAPTVTAVDPASAPNDLDPPIVITGTGFTAGMTVTLGNTQLPDAGWVSSTTLTATVPWGLDPGVYTLTVTNPNGQSGSLTNAFTVMQGIGVWTSGGPYGGQVSSIAINPITPTTLYASAMGVGVFRSHDGGENWEQVFYDNGYEDIVEMDPLNPNRIYTGRNGQGVYRSDDGGDTWTAVPFPVQGAYVNRAFAHPTVAGRVYAGLSEGGFFKSDDYGQTWVTKTNGLTDTQVMALAFHPTDALTMYAGTRNGNVFRSTNSGDSWEFMGELDYFVNQLAVNPFGAHELWAVSNFFGHPGHLWKYVSASWLQVSPDGPENAVNAIAFDRNISGTIWAGSRDVFTSTDGGMTWMPLGAMSTGGALALAVDPTDSRVVYRGDCGNGIYKTTDDGATWRQINHGLSGIIPIRMATVPGDPSTVYAMAEYEDIFKTTNGGGAWFRLRSSGEGAGPVVDPFTHTRIYVPTDGNIVSISEDGGIHWRSVFIKLPPQYATCCWSALSSMIATGRPGHLVMGTSFGRTGGVYNLFAGVIYTSTDFGETWSYVNMSQEISPVIALAYDPLDPMVIYAGTGDPERPGSGIWKSIDGGATWFQSGLSGRSVSGIAVDHRDSQTIYAIAGCLWISHDAGQTWSPVVSQFCASKLLYVPTTPSVLYMYDWRGMVRSTDGGQHWEAPAGALAHSNIGSMAVATTTDRVIIYVGTGGSVASSGAAQALSQASGETLVSAGVYRQTMRLPDHWVYLPIIFKSYAQ